MLQTEVGPTVTAEVGESLSSVTVRGGAAVRVDVGVTEEGGRRGGGRDVSAGVGGGGAMVEAEGQMAVVAFKRQPIQAMAALQSAMSTQSTELHRGSGDCQEQRRRRHEEAVGECDRNRELERGDGMDNEE